MGEADMGEVGQSMAEQRDPDAVRQFVERFALDLTGAGVPRMAARVFASLLVADDGRRTAAELAEVLEVSPAAVSGAVRYLTQVNLVAREPVPGQRRDQYRVLDDLWYASITNREARLSGWDRTLAEGQAALGENSAAAQRLGETREFFEFLREEVPALMQKWHRQRRSS